MSPVWWWGVVQVKKESRGGVIVERAPTDLSIDDEKYEQHKEE